MRLGLKGFWKETKGMYFRGRIKRFFFEIKLAWQRAYRGWDDTCYWDIDSWLKSSLIEILAEYKEKMHCLWVCPEEYNIGNYDEVCDKYILTSEQTNTIIDTIIFHLNMSDSDYVEKVVYGTCVNDDNWNFEDMKNRDYKKIERIRKQNQNAAMDLLKLFMDQLWDYIFNKIFKTEVIECMYAKE